jgi:hypothetical protein
VQNVLYPNVEPLEVKSAHIKSTRSVDAIHARCALCACARTPP